MPFPHLLLLLLPAMLLYLLREVEGGDEANIREALPKVAQSGQEVWSEGTLNGHQDDDAPLRSLAWCY